jgi:transposase
VTCFNEEGLAAIQLRHGTATWSLTLLRRALGKKGLKVGRFTVWTVLREAGFTWQRDRT